MTYSSRKIVISADAGLAFLVARAALPVLLTWLANFGGRKIPGYQGGAQRVDIRFAGPSLVVNGLCLVKFNGSKTEQLLDISSVILGSHWKGILTGSLVGSRPQLESWPRSTTVAGAGEAAAGVQA